MAVRRPGAKLKKGGRANILITLSSWIRKNRGKLARKWIQQGKLNNSKSQKREELPIRTLKNRKSARKGL
jgi:hypothetical protein